MTTDALLKRIAAEGSAIRAALQTFETDLREALKPIHFNAIQPDGQRDLLKTLEYTQKLAHYLLPPVSPPQELELTEADAG